MKTIVRTIVIAAIFGLLGPAAWGQASAPAGSGPAATKTINVVVAASQPAAEPILKMLPAGSLGYAAIQNIQAIDNDVEKYLQDIGAAELLKDKLPQGLLNEIIHEAKLGPGFNPNGGLAVVMLDPNEFGVDVMKLIKEARKGAASAPATAPAAETPKLPVVAFIPGSGVKEVFPDCHPEPAGACMQIHLGGKKLFAATQGGYVVISPNAQALEAVAKASKKADGELTGKQAQIVKASAFVVHLNAKASMPLVSKLVKAMDLMVEAQDQGLGDDDNSSAGMVQAWKANKSLVATCQSSLAQMDGLTLGGRITPTGVVFDGGCGYLADTDMARQLKNMKQIPLASLMDCLSGGPYMMAIGVGGISGAVDKEAVVRNFQNMWLNPVFAKVPKATQDKINQYLGNCSGRVTAIQFAVNRMPEGANGAMTLEAVFKGDDAQKIKDMLAEGVALLEEAIKGADPADASLQELKIAYQKDAEKVGEAQADAIVLTHPALEQGGIAPMLLSKMLGEATPRALVMVADKNTVVVSLGGGAAALQEALKPATGKGDILQDKDVQPALKNMPANLQSLVLINVANYFDAMVTGMSGGGAPPFQLTCKAPLAFGGAVEGNEQIFSAFVPTEVVRDVVNVFKTISAMQGGGRRGGANQRPMPKGEDF